MEEEVIETSPHTVQRWQVPCTLPQRISMSTITKDCLTCGRPFEAEVREHNRGNARFCSRKCSARRLRKLKTPNCECDLCGHAFYRPPSKQNSKSGLLFCSRACKERAQSLDTDGFEAIQPDHYGVRETTYRSAAMRHYPNKCDICGYDTHPEVLEVHHRDKNRKNNVLGNLQVLCPTCHRVEHFVDKGLLARETLSR